jgi:hypothetical protein
MIKKDSTRSFSSLIRSKSSRYNNSENNGNNIAVMMSNNSQVKV